MAKPERRDPVAAEPAEPGSVKAWGKSFPIIGIGASAGGLTAIQQFFTHLPKGLENEAAFVVVQHLSPDHKSMLVELVQRHVHIRVVTAEDGVEVEKGTVYVIPPNYDLSVEQGRLHLSEPVVARGLRLPVDYFFRSLANDHGELAVGIILSGTGTDGTLGLKSIKEAGGLVMVQTPETAEYEGMPRSALATHQVDYVLAPEQMPGRLLAYGQLALRPGKGPIDEEEDRTRDILEDINRILLIKKGIDFSHYKRSMTNRRIGRRMALHVIQNLNDYLAYLEQNPSEVEALFNDLTIGVTSFFRNPEAFDVFSERVIPEIVRDRAGLDTVRIWAPGCSTGEEAYSLAILFQEHLEQERRNLKVQIFATDIDAKALAKARQGRYSENIAIDISAERLERSFHHEGDNYIVRKSLRELVVFAEHNLIESPPFTRMDLICCRNLLIYLSAGIQKKLIPLFRYALRDDGFLFLGTSEGVGAFRDIFSVIDRRWKLYRCKGGSLSRSIRFDFTVPAAIRMGAYQPRKEESLLPRMGGRELVERFLLNEYAPVCVVIDEKMDILYIYGHSGDYLEPAQGDVSNNLMRMVRPALRAKVEALILAAAKAKKPAKLSGQQFQSDGKIRRVDLAVFPIDNPQTMQGLQFIVFQEARPADTQVTHPGKLDDKAAQDSPSEVWGEEIGRMDDYYQAVVEQLESANQELNSKNEEMQAMYEELQSANEELETAKEEMQSVNEELNTVNSELKNKLDELYLVNSDMKNMLTATGIATLFLDVNYRIVRYTPAVTGIINLIPGDIGRQMSDIVTNLEHGDLLGQAAKEVLETLSGKEVELRDKNGGWFLVRILPYRTLENVIDGVVITLTNITEQKQTQDKLKTLAQKVQDEREFAESIIATVREPLLVLDQKLRVVTGNRSFYKFFQVSPKEIVGFLLSEVSRNRWDIPTLLKLLREIQKKKNTIEEFPVIVKLKDGVEHTLMLNARKVIRKAGEENLILLAFVQETPATPLPAPSTAEK